MQCNGGDVGRLKKVMRHCQRRRRDGLVTIILSRLIGQMFLWELHPDY